MEEKRFMGKLPTGFPVLFWPGAVVDNKNFPYVAFVAKGWSQGVCDLSVLPGDQPGSCLVEEQVYSHTDPRLRDSYGKLSLGAQRRGCWTPVPWAPLPQEEEPVVDKKKPAASK